MARQRRERSTRVPDLLVEFCVKGKAVSWRAGKRGEKAKQRFQDWRDAVIKAANSAAEGAPVFAEEVDVAISEFSERQSPDRDNMAKPILDALQGISYLNDRQVSGLHVEWCNIEGSYKVRFMPFVVAAALSEGSPFVWVRVFRHRPRTTLES